MTTALVPPRLGTWNREILSGLLGAKVRDSVSGFDGIATARCEYVTGSPQIQIQPELSREGSWRDPRWFDEERVERVVEPAPPNLGFGSSPEIPKTPAPHPARE